MSELKKDSSRSVRRKSTPPEQTNAEEFYYLKQMAAKTPMVIVLLDGEELRGWIEWYDKGSLKLNRQNEPNLLIPKHNIRYMFKEEELRRTRGPRRRAAASRPATGTDGDGDGARAEADGNGAATATATAED